MYSLATLLQSLGLIAVAALAILAVLYLIVPAAYRRRNRKR